MGFAAGIPLTLSPVSFCRLSAHALALRQRLRRFTERWAEREPEAVRVFRRDLDACLTYLAHPPPWHRRLYNTNLIERYIEELRRRIIPMRSFNNAASAQRIIYGLVAYVINQE